MIDMTREPVKNSTMHKGGFLMALFALMMAMALVLPQAASAQVGGSAVVFLKIEPDSRASGMGNAGVALADNASAMFWNPAGLAGAQGNQFVLFRGDHAVGKATAVTGLLRLRARGSATEFITPRLKAIR